MVTDSPDWCYVWHQTPGVHYTLNLHRPACDHLPPTQPRPKPVIRGTVPTGAMWLAATVGNWNPRGNERKSVPGSNQAARSFTASRRETPRRRHSDIVAMGGRRPRHTGKRCLG